MGRTPCCDKVGLKKGPWTPEEDRNLLAYIERHGHGSWRALPSKAGLQRCGKSCRLRWTNYLRPDIKRGKFTLQEEQTIIQLHALLGNRWSAIATHLPKRTDNEIKNYWNTHLKKRLVRMGIDPVTHKPKNDAMLSSDSQSKSVANLSHMTQWESARLEAEARLARQSKVQCNSLRHQFGPSALELSQDSTSVGKPAAPLQCLDILKAWNGVCSKSNDIGSGGVCSGSDGLSFAGLGLSDDGLMKERGKDWMVLENSNHLTEFKAGIGNSISYTLGLQDITISDTWAPEPLRIDESENKKNFIEEFTELLLSKSVNGSFSEGDDNSDSGGNDNAYYGDKKNYWNDILDLVDSPMF